MVSLLVRRSHHTAVYPSTSGYRSILLPVPAIRLDGFVRV
jgi:hypothetical protein